jgi:hypothetical protein
MAVPNMIVTLAMNATKYASGLKKAATDTTAFGRFSQTAYNVAKTAMLGLTAAVIRFIPILANMGAASRKADIQMQFMLENMMGISAATTQTAKRLDMYAKKVMLATAIDDEQVKAVQKKLIMFKALRKTVDVMGGTFDRATSAAIDLAAGGFGTMETNAMKLGKMLEDPIANLNALSRAGVTFTAGEKNKIAALTESGKLLQAQDIILGSVEGRVKGLAEKSATPWEKMNAALQEIGDQIGTQLLGPLDDMNTKIKEWLASPQSKKDIQDIADAFVTIAMAIRDSASFLMTVRETLKQIKPFTDVLGAIGDAYFHSVVPFVPRVTRIQNSGGGNSSAPGGHTGGGMVVNFNAPIDSVSAGREISRVLSDYNRASGRR